jgi:adenylosuccinate synthase
LETLKVAVAYERGAERVETFPAEFGIESLAEWRPVYEELPGWPEDITAARSLDDLPPAARAYVARTEEHVGVPITLIGVGPGRDQAIVV